MGGKTMSIKVHMTVNREFFEKVIEGNRKKLEKQLNVRITQNQITKLLSMAKFKMPKLKAKIKVRRLRI
jgi:hypothetical protein